MRSSICRVLAGAALTAALTLGAACGSDDPPKTSATTAAQTTPAASATESTTGSATPAATPEVTAVPQTPPAKVTAPTGSTELTAGEYKDLAVTSLTCDGNNLLVLKTKDEIYYFQTLTASNFGCDNVRTSVLAASSSSGGTPTSVAGKSITVKYDKLSEATAAGSYQANMNWKDGGSTLVIFVQGWKAKA